VVPDVRERPVSGELFIKASDDDTYRNELAKMSPDIHRILREYLFGGAEDQAAIRQRLREDGDEPAIARNIKLKIIEIVEANPDVRRVAMQMLQDLETLPPRPDK